VISFVRTNNGGGFAFDNFNGTQAFVDVNSPLDQMMMTAMGQ